MLACAPHETPGQHHLLENVPIAEGDARRKLAAIKADPQRRQAAEVRRNLLLLADKLGGPGKTLAIMGPMLAKLGDEQAAAAVFDVASSYARQGQWLMAREAFLLLVEKYPTEPLSAEAYRWLIRHAASGEARRRRELGQFLAQTITSYRHAESSPC